MLHTQQHHPNIQRQSACKPNASHHVHDRAMHPFGFSLAVLVITLANLASDTSVFAEHIQRLVFVFTVRA